MANNVGRLEQGNREVAVAWILASWDSGNLGIWHSGTRDGGRIGRRQKFIDKGCSRHAALAGRRLLYLLLAHLAHAPCTLHSARCTLHAARTPITPPGFNTVRGGPATLLGSGPPRLLGRPSNRPALTLFPEYIYSSGPTCLLPYRSILRPSLARPPASYRLPYPRGSD